MAERATPLQPAIDTLLSAVGDATTGLPEEVFLLATRLTPMVNVDLLIRDERKRVLLTWRDDHHNGQGWHVPGGIIRFRERIADRLAAVARLELGASIAADPLLLATREFIAPEAVERSHFITFLYACQLASPPAPTLRHAEGALRPGVWQWFERCPDDLLPVHEVYRAYIDGHA